MVWEMFVWWEMGSHYFLPVFLIVLLLQLGLLIHSAGCPRSFPCGRLGNISFPFTNTTHPHCGLFVVICGAFPMVQLESEGRPYTLKGIYRPNLIEIADPLLQDLNFWKNPCDALAFLPEAFSLPDFISLANISSLILIRCSHNMTGERYFRAYHNYTRDCWPSFFYRYSHDQNLATPAFLPPGCKAVQLPAAPPLANRNASDLLSLLASDFYLQWRVSNACRTCHSNGGQCRGSGFQCVYPAKGTFRGWRVKTTIAASGVGGIGILIILACCFRKKLVLDRVTVFRNSTRDECDVEAFLKTYGTLAPKRYRYSEIKRIGNSFSEKLGEGGYGNVYKGKLADGRLVAIKMLDKSKGNGQEFINEVVCISRTSHVNIVALLGFCYERNKKALVYDFMPNGSLEKFIYNNNSNGKLGWETLYQISLGIARGLEYLHRGCNTRILHFDIKPHNILLDADFCPKISDFGLAKLCTKKDSIVSMVGTRGTAGYIAPEVYSRNLGGVSHKSDVYSYGMMVLEMVGGRKNLDVGVDRTSEIYFPSWIYNRLEQGEELGLQGLGNEEESGNARKMITVSLWCIQSDPSSRPAMSEVVDMLEGNADSLQFPPKPF